jgi:hypothetical protein
MRAQLSKAIDTLESSGRLSAVVPRDRARLTESEARTVFIDRLAISLWVETHHRVGWSLRDYSDREREELLGVRRLFHVAQGAYVWVPQAMDLDPQWALTFMTQPQRIPYLAADRTLAAATPLATIVSLIDRLRTLVHHGSDDDMGVDRPEARSIIDSGITSGCWGTSGLIATLLRSVNIPAEQTTHMLDGRRHSSINFPTIGNNTMTHGDNPYNRLLLAVPSGDLLIDVDKEWTPMSKDARLYHRWHAAKASTCINSRAVLESGCRSSVYARMSTNEVEPYLTPEEARAFRADVEAIRREGCATFSSDSSPFPLTCWVRTPGGR